MAENQPSNYGVILPFLIGFGQRPGVQKIRLFMGFESVVAKRKNGRIAAESLDQTVLGSCHESLSLVSEEFQQLADAPVVELRVQIVEEKERIFAASCVEY